MADREAKNALFARLADVAKALGNGHRAELIDVLAQGERSVEVLAGEIGQSLANTSFHLRVLASVGLVTTRREGTRVYYRLTSDRVRTLWMALGEVADAHIANLSDLVEAYVGDRSDLDTIDRAELARRMDGGEVIVVDVRNSTEYDAGHIAGARSVPIDELQARIEELPPGIEIVAYCRGVFCVYADEAVRLLAGSGRSALRLEGGFSDWQSENLPTETGGSDGAGP